MHGVALGTGSVAIDDFGKRRLKKGAFLRGIYHCILAISAMKQLISDRAAIKVENASTLSPAMMAGVIIIGSTLASALLFRTHGFAVTPLSLELIRHFGIFFMGCELLVFWIAIRAGLKLMIVFFDLTRRDRAALLIWLSTFAIGSLLSQEPAYSLIAVSSWPIHILFGLAIWHLAGQARMTTDRANPMIGAGIALVLVTQFSITVVHFNASIDPAFLPDGVVFWAGAIPGFMSVRLFGVAMTYAALFGAGMLLVYKERSKWWMAAMLLILGFAALCWSSTRAAVPAFFAALLVVPYITGCRTGRAAWGAVGAAVGVAFCVSLLIPSSDPSLGTLQMFGGAAANGGEITAGRIEIWQRIVAAIADRPVFGHGEGATRWLVQQDVAMHVQPHNIFLQVVLHWGFIASSAAIWLVGRLLIAMVAAVRQDRALLPYAMIVAASLVAALFDGALYYPQMVMLPVAALGYVLAQRPAKNCQALGTPTQNETPRVGPRRHFEA